MSFQPPLPLGKRSILADELWGFPYTVKNQFVEFILIHFHTQSGSLWDESITGLHLNGLLEQCFSKC